MAKNISSKTAYLKEPCSCCGSRRKIEKTWKETIPTFSGTTEVEYSQIICTNIICQEKQNKSLLEEKNKREEVRIVKEENKKNRKNNSLANAIRTRRNKSRI